MKTGSLFALRFPRLLCFLDFVYKHRFVLLEGIAVTSRLALEVGRRARKGPSPPRFQQKLMAA